MIRQTSLILQPAICYPGQTVLHPMGCDTTRARQLASRNFKSVVSRYFVLQATARFIEFNRCCGAFGGDVGERIRYAIYRQLPLEGLLGLLNIPTRLVVSPLFKQPLNRANDAVIWDGGTT